MSIQFLEADLSAKLRHRRKRRRHEFFLIMARYRIPELRENVIRARVSREIVMDRVVRVIPLDEKTLFAGLGVVGKRAVSETESFEFALVFDDVNDPIEIHRPKFHDVEDDANDFARYDRRGRVMQRDPRHVKHAPRADGRFGFFECRGAVAEQAPVVIGIVAARWRKKTRGAGIVIMIRGVF